MALNDLITIVVYLYNNEKYIKRTIDTILSSSYKELEIVVIDDASTDNSLGIAQEFLSIDSRLKIVEQKEKLGLGKIRNVSIEQAKGEYILFIDTNDTIPNNAIEKLYSIIKNLNADVVIGSTSFYNQEKSLFERNDSLAYTHLRNYENKLIPINYFQYNVFKTNHLSYGKLYKTSFIKENHIYFSQMNNYEDKKFWYSLLFTQNVKITFIDEEVYSYHYNDNRQIRIFGIEIFDIYEELKNLAENNKNEIFLDSIKKYLAVLYELSIEKSLSSTLPLYFFKIARKYLLTSELSNLNKKHKTHIKLLEKSSLLAYYWSGLDKQAIAKIIKSNALSRKLLNVFKAILS